METTKIIESAVNNAEYQPRWVDKAVTKETASVNNNVFNILDWINSATRQNEVLWEQKINFADMLAEQSVETDIARLTWAKPGAMLRDQLSLLWLHNKWTSEKTKNIEVANNSIFGSPDKTVQLWWPFEQAA